MPNSNSSSNPKTWMREKNSISAILIIIVYLKSRRLWCVFPEKRHRPRRAARRARVQQPRLNSRDAPACSIRTTLGCSCTICTTITTIPGLRIHRHRTGRPSTRSPLSPPALRVRQRAASAPCPAQRTPKCTRRTGGVAAGDISLSSFSCSKSVVGKRYIFSFYGIGYGTIRITTRS